MWIPISERLPDHDGYYEVKCKTQYLGSAVYYSSHRFFCDHDWDEGDEVVAWKESEEE